MLISPYLSKCLMCGKEFLNEWGKQKRYCGSKTKKTGCSYIANVNKARKFKIIHRERVLETSRQINNAEKLRIRQKYNFICQMCGLENKTNGFMDVEHKDGNRLNGDEKNLWILCPNCHRIKTMEQLKGIIYKS